jgi:leucyl/phenylalanyl-tRNA--protein transferase
MIFLSDQLIFPPVTLADENGLLAFGGDLSPERLILAYRSGIFPWYNPREPIIWYSPDPRMVLYLNQLKVSKSLRKVLDKGDYQITYNQNFEQVISQCKNIERKDALGTWITDEMEQAYIKLHQLGIAKSVEVWQNKELVGGLYGIDLDTVFCGESMFSKVSNASKIAFYHLTQKLEKENYKIIDCQVYNPFLESLGAVEIPRAVFMELLNFKDK